MHFAIFHIYWWVLLLFCHIPQSIIFWHIVKNSVSFQGLVRLCSKVTATLPPFIKVFRYIYKSFTIVAFMLVVIIDHSARCKLLACTAWVIDCSGYGKLFALCRLLACIKWAKSHKVCSNFHKLCTIVLWTNKAHRCTIWKIKYTSPLISPTQSTSKCA